MLNNITLLISNSGFLSLAILFSALLVSSCFIITNSRNHFSFINFHNLKKSDFNKTVFYFLMVPLPLPLIHPLCPHLLASHELDLNQRLVVFSYFFLEMKSHTESVLQKPFKKMSFFG